MSKILVQQLIITKIRCNFQTIEYDFENIDVKINNAKNDNYFTIKELFRNFIKTIFNKKLIK